MRSDLHHQQLPAYRRNLNNTTVVHFIWLFTGVYVLNLCSILFQLKSCLWCCMGYFLSDLGCKSDRQLPLTALAGPQTLCNACGLQYVRNQARAARQAGAKCTPSARAPSCNARSGHKVIVTVLQLFK